MKKLEALQYQYAAPVATILRQDKSTARALGVDLTALNDNDLFLAFAAACDPTAGRPHGRAWKFLPWICRQYKAQAAVEMPLRAEDFYKLKQDLRDFESRSTVFAANNQPSQIEHIHSYDALLAQLRPYQQERDARIEASRQRRMDDDQRRRLMAQTTIIYDGPEGKILIPHTKAASQHWGAQTRWCISATQSQNYFDSHDAAYAIIMYLPRPTAAERATWPYKSFKFAGVEKRLYDEQDRSHLKGVPPCLKKLAAAALNTLDPASAANLRTHGVIDRIENATDEIPPEEIARAPENPEYERALSDIISHFADHSDDTMDHFPAWRDNRDFHLYVLKRNFGSTIRHLPPGHAFFDDEEFALLAIKDSSDIIEKLSPRLRNDRAFLLRALEISPYIFKSLPVEMRADRDIVKNAISRYSGNMSYVYPEKRHYESTLRGIFRRHVAPIFSSLPKLRDDFEIATLAARSFSGFEELSRRRRRDRDLFARSGYYDLSDTLGGMNDDPEICLKAIERNNYNCPRVSRRLRGDIDWLLRAVAVQPGIVADAPQSIIRDREAVKRLVAVNGRVFPYLSIQKFMSTESPYAADRELAHIALSQNGGVYESLYDPLRSDPELAMMGARAGVSPRNMPSIFREDPVYWHAAITANPYVILEAQDHAICHNRELVKIAAATSPEIIQRIRGHNRTHRYDTIYDPSHDIGFMRDCVMRDARYFPMTPFALREDHNFMTALIRHYDETGRMAELGLNLRHYSALWGGDITNFTVADKALAKLNSTHMPAKSSMRWLADRQGFTL